MSIYIDYMDEKMKREQLEEYLEIEIRKKQRDSERLEEIFNDFMRNDENQ